MEVRWTEAKTGRSIARLAQPTEATMDLLNSTIWGSRSSRYRILNLADKLARLRDPSFFILTEEDQELGVIVIDRCTKDIAGKACDAFHFVMAATDQERRREGLAGIILEEVRRYCVETAGHPGFGFAYVESTTEFSLRLSDKIGHALEAEVPLLVFSRLWPTKNAEIQTLPSQEIDPMIRCLRDLYHDHELTDFERSLNAEEYFVLRKSGEIVAGLQAEPIRWSVVEMPGFIGWFLLSIVSRSPLSKIIIDLKDLKIVRFGNIYVQPGDERELVQLMEEVLAQHTSKVGLIMLDRRSPMLKRIRGFGRLGLFSGALRGSVKIRIDVTGMDDATLDRLSSRPILVSPADVI